jgi:hypothetical protein
LENTVLPQSRPFRHLEVEARTSWLERHDGAGGSWTRRAGQVPWPGERGLLSVGARVSIQGGSDPERCIVEGLREEGSRA